MDQAAAAYTLLKTADALDNRANLIKAKADKMSRQAKMDGYEDSTKGVGKLAKAIDGRLY